MTGTQVYQFTGRRRLAAVCLPPQAPRVGPRPQDDIRGGSSRRLAAFLFGSETALGPFLFPLEESPRACVVPGRTNWEDASPSAAQRATLSGAPRPPGGGGGGGVGGVGGGGAGGGAGRVRGDGDAELRGPHAGRRSAWRSSGERLRSREAARTRGRLSSWHGPRWV